MYSFISVHNSYQNNFLESKPSHAAHALVAERPKTGGICDDSLYKYCLDGCEYSLEQLFCYK